MALISSESIWTSMLVARQLAATYYTLATCLTDLLHHYMENSSSQKNKILTSLFHKLDQTLFSSSSTSINQSKLLDEYSNILQNILKQNSLHNNIIQNVRRLFRFDSFLKDLFTTEVNEYCHCLECDCTISNNITDVIHEVGEIQTKLLIVSSQISCACSRCGDPNQMKTLTFKQFSPCLALTMIRLNINATDQLTNPQGVTYTLSYVIEFDSTSRSIINVYLRENTEFIKVDGENISSRLSTISGQGKFLTLWLSRPTLVTIPQTSEAAVPHNDTFLSPPPSQSSSTQVVSNLPINNETSISYPSTSTIDLDDSLMPSNTTLNDNQNNNDNNNDDDDDDFWNSLTEQTFDGTNDNTSATLHDSVTDTYLTLLHATNKTPTSTKCRTEHDRTVNRLASSVLWPLIVDQTHRHNESTASSSTTTAQFSSSNSSHGSSLTGRNRLYKRLSSTVKYRRAHPYSTT